MKLRAGEISFWQQCVLARLGVGGVDSGNNYHKLHVFKTADAIENADRAVIALRKRLESETPDAPRPYREGECAHPGHARLGAVCAHCGEVIE